MEKQAKLNPGVHVLNPALFANTRKNNQYGDSTEALYGAGA